MKNSRFLFLFLMLLGQFAGFGQDVSNKGQDFWLGYGYHVNMAGNPTGGGTQDMVLYFTSDKNANVTVDIPGVGYTQKYTVVANQVTTSNPIPKTGTQDARVFTTGISNRGIHVTSDVPIVAYAHIYNASVSGASLLFPTNTLGKDYYSINFTQSSNAANANSFFFVVATEDNTTVDITPSAATLNGLPVGVATTVTLNAGQIFNVMGTTNGTLGTDLTGSRIQSRSASGSIGCKKIAVFSGAGKMSIGGNGNASGSADNLFAQAFPSVAWGKKYLTVPTGSQPNNYYRVCVTDPTTVVKLNGTVIPPATLVNNFYYQFKNGNASGTNPAVPNLIEADKPVLVAQYCTTQGQDGNPNTTPFGDPEMIYLSPVEQTINSITLYSASKYLILQSYINVIIKNEGIASFTLDGAKQASNFSAHPQDNNYSYAILTVSSGSHTLYSDIGFNAIAYGFGSAESYGYNAGTNIRDFSPTATFQNPYNRIDSAVTCINTAIQFSVPLTFQPTSLKWDFTGAPNLSSNPNVLGPLIGIAADSVKSINGLTLNYYSTKNSYSFSASNVSGTKDIIKLYTTSATPDGCGSTDQVFTIPITVNEKPVAKFVFSNTGCVTDSVYLTYQNTGSANSVNRLLWNYGDGRTDDRLSSAVFPIKYASGGNYLVKLKAISDIGCVSDEVSQTINISNKPIANFTFSTVTCTNSDITFTDASTSSSGPITKWTWSLDDGASPVVNTSNASVKTQYTSGGVKNPSLQVETGTGCKSDPYTPITTLKVNPVPSVGFIVPEVCLSDANAPFIDTSSISEGSISKYLWNFNASSPSVTPGPNISSSTLKNPQVKYNKSDYYKVSLTLTSSLGCVATKTQDFTVNGTNPKADFTLTNTSPFCGVKPVLLKNTSSVDFGNVTKLEIYWDYANNPTIKELDDNPTPGKIYPHAYSDLQLGKGISYTIRLVAYSGGSSCIDFTSKTITVYPQPKAVFNASASQLCFGDVITFLDKSNVGSGTIVNWIWDLGKGDMSSIQNPQKQYNDSVSQTVSLYFTNSDGCISDTANQTLTIFPNPKLILPHKITVLIGGVVTIVPTYVYGSQLQYLWTPATYLSSDTAATPKAIPNDDITYKLTLSATGGCSVTDTVYIRVLKGPEVPNVFSPNGDGINDTWRIKYLDGYPGATVEVYNRYGQIVFRSLGYDVEWNGTYNGNPLPVGTYYYIINPKNGREIIQGSVTIIK